MLHTVFQAYVFDFKPQPPDRRRWQFQLMLLPLLGAVVGFTYLNVFFDDLMKFFVITLETTGEEAVGHVSYRKQTLRFFAMAFVLSLVFNRMYLTCFTIAFMVLGAGQFYDYWGRLTLDRSLFSTMKNYQLDYIFMLANVGTALRVSFLATIGYGAWVTLKKNMDLMAAKPL